MREFLHLSNLGKGLKGGTKKKKGGEPHVNREVCIMQSRETLRKYERYDFHNKLREKGRISIGVNVPGLDRERLGL